MKKKLNLNKIAVTMLSAMMLVSGCGSYEPETQEITRKDEEVQTTKTEDEAETKTFMTTDGFVPLSQIKMDYKFQVEEAVSDDELYTIKTYKGEYALSNDTVDNIVVTGESHGRGGAISINGVQTEHCAVEIEEIAIVDIDANDDYKEVAILDNGPSDDYTVTLYRFVDGKLYELGYFLARHEFDDILFNKSGRIIDSVGYIYFIDTKMVLEYYDVKEHKACNVKTDYESALNKKYVIDQNINVAFGETGNMELTYEATSEVIDYLNVFQLKAGDEIVIIKENMSDGLFYVELSDGRRGVLTIWIAG